MTSREYMGNCIAGVVVGVPGLALLWTYTNWQAVVGVALLMWGNNIVIAAQDAFQRARKTRGSES